MGFAEVAEFVVLGFGVGVYGTMVGAGGGFLIVPVLLLMYHADPARAAGTSITVVFFNAFSGSLSYARQKRIDYRAGLTFAVATVPGAVAGAYMAELFKGRDFHIIFAILLLAIAGVLIWRPTGVAEEGPPEPLEEHEAHHWWKVEHRIEDASGHVFHYRYNILVGTVLSIFVGFLSSILGIGGGIIHVPALIHLLAFPAHVATATSHFILAISALVGAVTHFGLGHVMVGPALTMGVGVVVGAQLGARLARRVHGAVVIRMLSLALVVVAVRLLMK